MSFYDIRDKSDIRGKVTKAGYRNYVRTRFLTSLRDVEPRPLTELKTDIYDLLWLGQKLHPNPFSGPNTNVIKGKLAELDIAITSWKNRWNLVESCKSDLWLTTWAKKLFCYWDASEVSAKRLLLPSVGVAEPLANPSPFLPKPYALVDPLTNTLFVPHTKAEYFKNLSRLLHEHLKEYSDAAEMTLKAYELREFEEMKERDLIWAVRWQVSEHALSALADDPKRLFRGRHDARLRDPDDVDPVADIENKDYHKTTVLRAVRKVLEKVGISPRN